MAKAEKKEVVTKTTTVVLEMTVDEAQALYSRIYMECNPGAVEWPVYEALFDAGFRYK